MGRYVKNVFMLDVWQSKESQKQRSGEINTTRTPQQRQIQSTVE